MRCVPGRWGTRQTKHLSVILLSMALVGAPLVGDLPPRPALAGDHAATAAAQKAALALLEDAFSAIADAVEPAVVAIEARATAPASTPAGRAQPRDPGGGGGDDEEFSVPFEPLPHSGTPVLPSPKGGSGLIVRAQGETAYILTNDHVVRGRDRFRVTLQDKSVYPATLVGADEKSDLAVLKIATSRPLPERAVAALGDSDRVRVGQWAIAIGSPYGYDQTLTVGVISARGRTVEGPGRRGAYTDLLQTDAAINQGNSGGPLVNIDGEVIGINVLIAAAPGAAGSIGIGFAIPINVAKAVLDPLIEQGKVTRSWLGVQTSLGNGELAPELKVEYGVPDGALVEDVTPGSPAARAGLRSEDVIIRFGERPIHRFSELEQAVGLTRPQSQVSVTLVRDQRELTVPLTLSKRPSEEALARLMGHPAPQTPAAEAKAPGWSTKFGLTVRQPGAAAEPGVEVAAVAPGSPAADAGLAPGDLIQKVGRAAVPNLARFRRVIATASESAPLVVRVRFQRTGLIGIRVLRP